MAAVQSNAIHASKKAIDLLVENCVRAEGSVSHEGRTWFGKSPAEAREEG